MDSLASLITARSCESPTSPYLEDARSGRVVTFADLEARAAEWAHAFAARGVSPGATVVIDVGDPLGFAVAHLSVVASGRRSVPVNPQGTWAETLKSVALGSSEAIVTDRAEPGDTDVQVFRPESATGAPQAGEHQDPAPRVTETASAGSVILFTSGSTGSRKASSSPRRSCSTSRGPVAEHNALTSADRGFNSLPLFHVNAEVVGLLSTLVAGATLVLDDAFHRTGFWELLAERRITWLNAVPAILAVLARGAEPSPPDRAPLRPLRLLAAARGRSRPRSARHPAGLSYGMTEGASQITATPARRAIRARVRSACRSASEIEVRGRRRLCPARRRDRRAVDPRARRRARLSLRSRRRTLRRRRLARDRRPRLGRQGRFRLSRRPLGRRDQPGRREGLPGRGRGGPARRFARA